MTDETILYMQVGIAIGVMHQFCKRTKHIPIVKHYFTMFFLGYVFKMGLDMLAQDLMGKERWFEFASKYWMDLSPFWGGAIALITVLVGAVIIHNKRNSWYGQDRM